jgi:hypothetical protein
VGGSDTRPPRPAWALCTSQARTPRRLLDAYDTQRPRPGPLNFSARPRGGLSHVSRREEHGHQALQAKGASFACMSESNRGCIRSRVILTPTQSHQSL